MEKSHTHIYTYHYVIIVMCLCFARSYNQMNNLAGIVSVLGVHDNSHKKYFLVLELVI